jgi:hypothetical protein
MKNWEQLQDIDISRNFLNQGRTGHCDIAAVAGRESFFFENAKLFLRHF